MSQGVTAVVIGGGVIGLSTAYQLAKKRVGRVILLEKERVGAGASSRAGGIITGLLWTETGILARKISLSLFQELSAELADYGYRFQDVGCLNLFDPADWPEREALLPLYEKFQVPHELIDAAEIEKRWPELKPRADIKGLFDPLGGYSEPEQYLPALAQRCRDLGVEIREGALVTGIERKNSRVQAVTTSNETIPADVVVCTVHVWTLRLLAELDWAVPVKSFVHQRYTTTLLPTPVHIPAINANPYEGYIRPAAGNRILVGGETPERIEFAVPSLNYRMEGLAAPPQMKETLFDSFRPFLPRIGETTWESEKVGLLSFSLDDEPIVGEAPHIKGLFLGTAFHSGGFAYNPVAGLLLAELAAGERPSVDITTFSPARFSPEATARYLAQAKSKPALRRH
ncbi:MAG: FAD-binding oxidoreductase [Chloroflexota bacterium]